MQIERGIPAPELRIRIPRMTDELKAIQVDESVMLDVETALALISYIRLQGGKSVRRKTGERIRVWRIQ